MLDLSHIPNSQEDIKVFFAKAGNLGYQTWHKPRKCNFVYIISIDGGGGGSSGYTNTTLGTSGGGAGSVTRALIDSKFIPDTLLVKVGRGGKGGAAQFSAGTAQNTGATGEVSGIFVATSQVNSQSTGNNASSFLGGFSTAAGGSLSSGAGAAATIAGASFLVGLINFVSIAGTSGANANTSVTPVDIQPLTSQINTGGAGGGGPRTIIDTAYNGGSINSSSFSPRIAGGIGDAALGTNGAHGFTSWKPFFSTGGAGGGGASGSACFGGRGGDGGIGSGGGAGGSVPASSTTGAGGDGGDGIVIIVSF